MPRRTNAFQGLIYRIQRTAASGAVVTESKLLSDSLTGALVEVDVVVEQNLGGHAIIVGVECTAEARAATVEWVNEMHAKHATLPTHHLVLVSRAGFSDGARLRAAALQIAAYTLAEAVEADWTTIVGRLHTVWLARLDAKLSGCQAMIGLAGETDAACDVPPNISVHRLDKSVIGTAREIGEAALRLEECREPSSHADGGWASRVDLQGQPTNRFLHHRCRATSAPCPPIGVLARHGETECAGSTDGRAGGTMGIRHGGGGDVVRAGRRHHR